MYCSCYYDTEPCHPLVEEVQASLGVFPHQHSDYQQLAAEYKKNLIG